MLKVRLVRSRGRSDSRLDRRACGAAAACWARSRNISSRGWSVGDTFVFGGEVVRYEQMSEDQVYVSRANDKDAEGAVLYGRQVSALDLSRRAGAQTCSPTSAPGTALPEQVRDWLSLQAHFSRVPGVRELVVETFPRANKHYLVCYPFEGRLAHQTLGMLLTRRLERAARPAARLRRQ